MISRTSEIIKYVSKNTPVNYQALLMQVQKAQTDNLWELSQGNITTKERQDKVIAFISKQIHDVTYEGHTQAELIHKLYNDIEEYSILTEYLNDDNVEGININSWRDIRVKYYSGKEIKAESFISSDHAIVILKRLLQNSNVTIDDAVPVGEASINSNVRIEAIMSPIVDKDVGISCYIRKLRDKVFTTQEYIDNNFATKDVLSLIQIGVKYGVSTHFVGRVNTGKTTLVKHALDSLPDTMQIITIESGAREMNLVKEDENGNVVNNVVHMLTRTSDKESNNITQEKLVVAALRLNPDVLSVAEMRDVEAYAAVEASLSGHTVVSTVHAGSVKQGHKRIAGLCNKKYPVDYHTALTNACEAFPLGVFIHTTEDGIRRIMNISECYVDGKDEIHYNVLWEYQVEENVINADGSVTVKGEYVQVNNPSENLVSIMKMYGITTNELKSLYKGGN